MATGNQGGDHLTLHTVDAHLLPSRCRAQRRSVGDGGLGGRGGGGSAVTGRREGRAVRREPVGIRDGSGARLPSVNTLGLRVLQGFRSRDDWREPGGSGLTGLENSVRAPF